MRHSYPRLSRTLRTRMEVVAHVIGIVFGRSGTDEKETVPTAEIVISGFGHLQEEPRHVDFGVSARSFAASPEALGYLLVHREQARAVS
jgi:hypothetical protein